MLNLKVAQKKNGATLLGRVNNAGAWKKIQTVRSVEAGQKQIELITLAQADDAVEKIAAWIVAHPEVKMKPGVDAAVVAARFREDYFKIELELTLKA